jgi:tRNA-splicing ligase RtcB
MPFIFPHLALMPDAHLGKGATVGSVIPTLGAIIPAAVGVDIGCGMIAVRTQFPRADFTNRPLSELRESIERAIPLSAGRNNATLTDTAKARCDEDLDQLDGIEAADRIAPNWRLQLGTLGSGNHFIEVTVDENDAIWLFLHSGSRGVGNKLAVHHIKRAQQLCKQWWIQLPDPDLAYLVEGTEEFDAYIRDLRWAQHFALLNREEMMDRVVTCVTNWIGEPVDEQERINCHHNFTQRERHFGKDVWLSRKGAIEATVGKPGLIPGSMGTASYVVVGKGNPVSLNSSPHGAGRNYSRSAARKKFTAEQLREAMAGIEYRDTDAFIDEIPQAYKDIDEVMADAADLVEIRHTLRQIVNVKGD